MGLDDKEPAAPLNSTAEIRIRTPLPFASDGKTVCTYDYTGPGARVRGGDREYVGPADASTTRWRAVSPDGKVVAAAEYDPAKRQGWVVLRDAATGKEVRRLSSGGLLVSDGRWSKDGTRLAAATEFRAWVWEVATGKSVAPTVPGHEATANHLTFLSDGRLVTNSTDGTLRAWDPRTGKELATLVRTGPNESFWQLAASPDGSLLAGSVETGNLRVWDSKTGAEVYKLKWGAGRPTGTYRFRFAADAQTLLTYHGAWHLRAWDLRTKSDGERGSARPPPRPGHRGGRRGLAGDPIALPGTRPDGDTLVLPIKKAWSYSMATGKSGSGSKPTSSVEFAVLSPDGMRLATYGPGPEKAKGTGRRTIT